MRGIRILVPLFVAFLGGCQEGKLDNLTPHPVTGKVIYDGKPAAGVKVTLIPTDAPMVPKIPQNPHAVTKSDGTFTISTFAEGDGAPEGGYQVVLAWPADPAEKAAKGEKVESSEEGQDTDRLMGWYDPLHSTVNMRVKPGSNTIPAINIQKITGPPPASRGIPGRN